MKNKLGIFCMILGTALLLGALSLFLRNQHEAADAANSAEALLPQIIEMIKQNQSAAQYESLPPPATEGSSDEPTVPTLPTIGDIYNPEMTVAEINGYGYVGYLSIPSLGLELPIMSKWDYARLKIAPCRYTGSTKTDDLVLSAHNYSRHFGAIAQLKIGATVIFTDMDGVVSTYEVKEITVLPPTAVEEMTAGIYDLTMFTCTYGGKSRVTVRCDRVMDK